MSATCLAHFSCDEWREVLQQSDILGREAILSQLDSIYNQYVSNINR